jgi:hypothetical protein
MQCFRSDYKAIVCDYAAFAKRLRSVSSAIANRLQGGLRGFRSDFTVIAKELRIDSIAISQQFRSVLASIS